jgi:hypothetical protein
MHIVVFFIGVVFFICVVYYNNNNFNNNLRFLKQEDLTCNKMVDFGQCMTDVLGLGCFWLYDSASGTTGDCRAKNDESLGCEDAKTVGQCTLDDVNKFGNNCFWLYNSASGTTGVCQTKTNTSLACGDAKTPGQCTWDKVDSFGTNCVWLEGNATRGPEFKARCIERVCVKLFR